MSAWKEHMHEDSENPQFFGTQKTGKIALVPDAKAQKPLLQQKNRNWSFASILIQNPTLDCLFEPEVQGQRNE